MPPRATVEEVYDDPDDLPLPSKALPNTGTRGALLEEITSDDDEDMEIPLQPTIAPRAAPPVAAGASSSRFTAPGVPAGARVTTDRSQFKDWLQIYPIYIDAKQPFKSGCRRIAREKSVWWPLSMDIAQAASILGLNVVHEAQAFHPRDWANPGRVRINWKEAVKQRAQIKTKKQLLEVLSGIIQQRRPELVPKIKTQDMAQGSEATQVASSSKVPAPSKHKQRKVHTPRPPKPAPPIAQRLPSVSPAVISGDLVNAVKAGMDAMKQTDRKSVV